MMLGERLLDLADEYRHAKDARHPDYAGLGAPTGREPVEIAADYEAALRELLD